MLHAGNVNRKERVKKAVFISYAMTGNVDGFFDVIKGHEFDEYIMYYPVVLLAQHANKDNYGGTYRSVASYIENHINDAINNKDIMWYSIKDKKWDDRDSNYYYLAIFEYVTRWIEDYKDYMQLHDRISSDNDPIINELEDKTSLFRFADEKLRADLTSTFRIGQKIDETKINKIYLKYLKKLPVTFPDDIAKYLMYMYKAGLGKSIDQKAYEVVSDTSKNTDPLVKEQLILLLTVAYSDTSRRNNEEWKNKFHGLFGEYNIKEEDLGIDIRRREIYDSLSTTGKYEYRAACIQYDTLMEREYGLNDAGMLSMGFYRIIENESNERIWLPISRELNYASIETLMDESIKELKDNGEDHNIRSKWNQNLNTLRNMSTISRTDPESKYLMLGNLKFLFEELHKGHKLALYVREILFNHLTEEGKVKFEEMLFDEWYSDETRNKFRNPPAHNKYLSLRTAIEGKNYVEDQLLELKHMLRS